MRLPAVLAELPIPVRFGVLGALSAGVAGAVVGLVLGLRSYVATAWAATFEVGVPAALLGAIVGIVIGGILSLAGRTRTHSE